MKSKITIAVLYLKNNNCSQHTQVIVLIYCVKYTAKTIQMILQLKIFKAQKKRKEYSDIRYAIDYTPNP